MTPEEIREFLEMCKPEITVLNLMVGRPQTSGSASYEGIQQPDEKPVEYYATFEKIDDENRVWFWLSNSRCTVLGFDQIKAIQTVPWHEIAEITRICEFVIGHDLQAVQKKVVGEIIEFLNKLRQLSKK